MYGVERFLIDFVRSYEASAFPVRSVHLTFNQWISIAVVLFALARLFSMRRTRAVAGA
jgi:prolipoprotein diacylglyceryltransferase